MSGYIGNIPVPQATQTRDTFTATASQTTFATSGYTPSFLDVFLNGVHLVNGTDYTATNGSDVVLTSGAAAGDTLEVVAYSTYQVNSQNYTGGLTVDNDGATVLTVDRATSDGTIIDLQKNGSSVGSIGTPFTSELYIQATGANSSGLLFTSGNTIQPRKNNAADDGNIDIGTGGNRFKNLYLSGGVYVGGTGAANYLDDYEEGTWTPSIVASASESGQTYVRQQGTYTKIGNRCYCSFSLILSAEGTFSGTYLLLSGLPFNISSSGHDTVMGGSLYFVNLGVNVYSVNLQLKEGDNKAYLWAKISHSGSREYLSNTDLTNNTELSGQFFYLVA